MQMPALALLSALVVSQAPAAPPTVPTAEIDAIFAAYDEPTSPGCAIAVYEGDRIAFQKAYGMANLDHDVPLTTSTVFHVASISKQFTGTAILLLAQQGKLSIDDDIRKYLPEMPDGPKITIRQLANHTSGIRDQWDLLGLAGWRYSRDLITDEDVMEVLTRQKELNFQPGDQHLYSNSGFTLMALIVSRVSGKSFRQFTTENIFKPLGMTNTHYRDQFSEIVKNQAYGYAPDGDTYRLSVTNFDTAGATSLLTTVADLAKWYANFDTYTVGGVELQAKLLERGMLNSGRRIPYAFGIMHGEHRGFPTLGHSGSDAGYRADFVRFPGQRLGVATLCNLSSANPGQLSRRVADLFLPSTTTPADEAPARPGPNAPEVALPEPTLRKYAGFYWNSSSGASRVFVLEDGALRILEGRTPMPLKSLGNSQFISADSTGSVMTFTETPSGIELRTTNTAAPLIKAEPFTPTDAQIAEYAGDYRSDEMDAVFRFRVHQGALRLERSRMRPSAMVPLVTDTFRGAPGMITFTRDAEGGVNGFVLQGSRVRHVKFRRDGPTRPATLQK